MKLYHGTSSENIPRIKRDGLLAYGGVNGQAVYPWEEDVEPQIFLTQNIDYAKEWCNDALEVFGGECAIIVLEADEIFKDFKVAKMRSETIVFSNNIPSEYIKHIEIGG